jgi:aminoglycoside 2''-phosphotransferase
METFWERIVFYQGTFALLEALFGIENQDEGAFKSGIASYV